MLRLTRIESVADPVGSFGGVSVPYGAMFTSFSGVSGCCTLSPTLTGRPMLVGPEANLVEGSQMRRIVSALVALASLILAGGAGSTGF
jgi:hypothetical protein